MQVLYLVKVKASKIIVWVELSLNLAKNPKSVFMMMNENKT